VRSATSIDGVRSDPTTTPSRRLWEADQRALEKMDPWRDPNIVIEKREDGTLFSRPRDRSASDAPPAAGDQPQTQQRAVGPATSDGGKLKIGELELSEADVRGLMERKSVEDSRKASMPANAQAYETKLPAGFQLPPGTEWTFDTNNPGNAAAIGAAKEWAFRHQLDQSAFSELLGMHAANQLAEAQQFQQVQRQQLEMLGPAAAQRVDAVNTWLSALLGSKPSESLRRGLFLADQVKAFEGLMRAFIGQGVSGNPGSARDGGPETPGKLSDEDYGRLSYHEKLVYAESFNKGGR
jgi:hypothetical protein